jgi:hypothetical protein
MLRTLRSRFDSAPRCMETQMQKRCPPEFELCVLPISVLEIRAGFEHRVLEDTEDCPTIEAELGFTVPKLGSHISAPEISIVFYSSRGAVSNCL